MPTKALPPLTGYRGFDFQLSISALGGGDLSPAQYQISLRLPLPVYNGRSKLTLTYRSDYHEYSRVFIPVLWEHVLNLSSLSFIKGIVERHAHSLPS